MSIVTTRRIASQVLGVGRNRVKILPGEIKRAQEALTRDDVRALIKEKIIYVERKQGVSRARAKIKSRKKKLGRARGAGSMKGRKHSRITGKAAWMRKVRAQRAALRQLKGTGKLKEGAYRKTYLMVKGGYFKSKASMLSHLKDTGMVKEK